MLTRTIAVSTLAATLLTGCVASPPAPPPPGALGYQCIAGVYQCRLPQLTPVGSPCSCPGIGAPSYGAVR